jgi:formate-dependent nitrite reductase membrane component NrfD
VADDPRAFGLTTDGRDIDPRLGGLAGAAAGQHSEPVAPDRPMPGAGRPVWDRVPSEPAADGTTSYYGQPIVKAPPWGPAIPAYVVLGGLAGAAATLAAATQSDPSRHALTTASRWLTLTAGGTGSVLLLSDLGRPERFLNMFRVARPTSPMSVGVYVLSGTLGAAAVAALGTRAGRLGQLAGTAAGVLGVPLSGYTAVLLATTALPGWHVGGRTLPPLFMASAVASAASALTLVPLGPAAQPTVDRYRVAGQVAELVAGQLHDRALAPYPRTRAAYRSQLGWRLGPWLTAGSIAASAVPQVRRSTLGRLVIGGLGLAGSIATKVAVFHAGMATAADPQATIEQQAGGA